MPITIIPSSAQAAGAFDGGRILERKPIGFPQDGGSTRPVSNLFYWAHAWSDQGGLIGEHPHKGFEIVSFVLNGEIQHYDSRLKGWKTLTDGGLQIIRAGSGITHAERLMPGAHIFQVWFDPGLERTLSKEASYDDYAADDFPRSSSGGVTTVTLKGEGSPCAMDSEGVLIRDFHMEKDSRLSLEGGSSIVTAFAVRGTLRIGGQEMPEGSFLMARGESGLQLSTGGGARLFSISVPEKVPYVLYKDMFGRAY